MLLGVSLKTRVLTHALCWSYTHSQSFYGPVVLQYIYAITFDILVALHVHGVAIL